MTLYTPWAGVVAAGIKRVENRPWPPPKPLIGNLLAIHAGLNHDKAAEASMRAGAFAALLPRPYDEIRQAKGCIVAVARVVGSIYGFREMVEDEFKRRGMDSQYPWFFGPYGWLLEHTTELKAPVPCRGFQRVWKLPADVEAAVTAQL